MNNEISNTEMSSTATQQKPNNLNKTKMKRIDLQYL